MSSTRVEKWDDEVVRAAVRRTCQFQDFRGEVFQYRTSVYSSFGTNTDIMLCPLLEETMDTTDGELLGGLSRGCST